MTTIRPTSSTWLILALLPLMIIGCQLGIEPQPASTPLPPATPLPPNTPVPPPTAVPRAIQRHHPGPVYVESLYRTANNLEGSSGALGKLVANSTVIVIGSVPNNDHDAIRIQDQAAPNVQVVGSGFNIQVERYLKGSGDDTIPIVQFYGLDYTDKGESRQTRDTNEDLLLGKNSRYLLFLIENGSVSGYWMGTAHPYKFLLKGGRAKAESPVGDLRGAFPEQSEADFISSVESRIAENP